MVVESEGAGSDGFDLEKILELERRLNKGQKLTRVRLLPTPHLRYNTIEIGRALFPVQPLPPSPSLLYFEGDPGVAEIVVSGGDE